MAAGTKFVNCRPLTPDEYVEGLLSKEASEQPSDTVKPEQLDMTLPDWFDEELYNKGRRFFWENAFGLSVSMLYGLQAVLAVPSILKILIGTKKSSSVYTAYKRYLSTFLHVNSWFRDELKPGTESWKSLFAVRSRHLRASLSSKLKGTGVISQRDVALTQFGFVGFSVLKPHLFGVRQLEEGDWEAYNHFWRVILHMLGLHEQYNLCRPNIEETRIVCQKLMDKVFTPCLENVPEYFEHMARVMLDGFWSVNPTIDVEAALYWVRYLADVPGYVYNETERIKLQQSIKNKLRGQSLDTPVDASVFISAPAVDGLPARQPRLLYYKDYETLDTVPAYKNLNLLSRYKIGAATVIISLLSTYLGRIFFNLNYYWTLILVKYCPYLSFFRYGIKASFVDMFEDDPVDETTPKPNSEFNKPQPPMPWYKVLISFFSFL